MNFVQILSVAIFCLLAIAVVLAYSLSGKNKPGEIKSSISETNNVKESHLPLTVGDGFRLGLGFWLAGMFICFMGVLLFGGIFISVIESL